MARPNLRSTCDLIAIVTVTAVLALCVILSPSGALRVILGLPFVLFFPGYTLVAVMFPRRGMLTGVERLTLSFVFSLAVVPLIGLILNYAWELSTYPLVASISTFIAVMCLLAYQRRTHLAREERFEPRLNLQVPQLGRMTSLNRGLAILLVIILIVAIAGLFWAALQPRVTQRFTEFYLVGSNRMLSDYPSTIVLGVDLDVTVGIVNHERESTTYQIRVLFDAIETQTIQAIALENNETWEHVISLTPTTTGDNQRVEFLLYRVNESEPYRELHLWIDVRDPSAPQ